MRQNQNLYEYLYRSLVMQIQCGAYLQKKILPSQAQLCIQYNVGITTVRKVLQILADEGYIHTAPGQPATVCYTAPIDQYIANLAGRRQEVADAFEGLGLLLPVLYREGARRCGELELQALQRAIDGIKMDMEPLELYRQANYFFTALLQPFHNQLIFDLELDAENFLYVPYFAVSGTENPFLLQPDHLINWLQTAKGQIAAGQFDLLYKSIIRFYRETAKKTDDYLKTLSCITNQTVSVDMQTHWFRAKGRSELYARLAMTILRRIVSGEFNGCKFLPSIPQIMAEYGVMKNTASCAVALLNSLGVVQTIEKKGTIIVPDQCEQNRVCVDITTPVVQKRLSLFWDAFSIIVLTARACAEAFIPISAEFIRDMEYKLQGVSIKRMNPLSVQVLMHCLIQLSACHSLKNIFQQLNELLLWGYYLQSALPYPEFEELRAAMEEVKDCVRQQKQEKLPQALERAFLQIYRDICNFSPPPHTLF